MHGHDTKLIKAIHTYQKGRDGSGLAARVICNWGKLQHLMWSVISGSDISREAKIARTVRFPHLTGVVIHQDAVIEDNCLIMQQVTLGQVADGGAPHLEAGAYAGTGAKILGAVRIGAGARIGANAVVLQDVPAGATAVGVPAVIKAGKPG